MATLLNCYGIKRVCSDCLEPTNGNVSAVAFVRNGVNFADYADALEWLYHIDRKDAIIVHNVRGTYAGEPVIVPGYGKNATTVATNNFTLTYFELFDCAQLEFYNKAQELSGWRVFMLTDAGLLEVWDTVSIIPSAPINSPETLNEYAVTVNWQGRYLPVCRAVPPKLFDSCQELERQKANYCKPCELACDPEFDLFQFAIDVNLPLNTGEKIWVTAYSPACPLPITASTDSWYYQPLVNDFHFTLDDAVANYSAFLGLLATGSYATVSGNVVSVYINKAGWRNSRQGFVNKEACNAGFGFCASAFDFEPLPTFEARVLRSPDCCDECICNCTNPMYVDNPTTGNYDNVGGSVLSYLINQSNGLIVSDTDVFTLMVDESVTLQLITPGYPSDCCGDDIFITVVTESITIGRGQSYISLDGSLRYDLTDTTLTVTHILGVTTNNFGFVVRVNYCGAPYIVNTFDWDRDTTVYCPFVVVPIDLVPSGATTDNNGQIAWDSLDGGCGLGTLSFDYNGIVPPCCTGGEDLEIEVFDGALSVGTLEAANSVIITPTVTANNALFTLVSSSTTGFVVTIEQDICTLTSVTGNWLLRYTFELCGETIVRDVSIISIPAPPPTPCDDGSYEVELDYTFTTGLTLLSDTSFVQPQPGPGGYRRLVSLEWDDDDTEVSFDVFNPDIGVSPACCDAFFITDDVTVGYGSNAFYGAFNPDNGIQFPIQSLACSLPIADPCYLSAYSIERTQIGTQNQRLTLRRNSSLQDAYFFYVEYAVYFCNEYYKIRVEVCNKSRNIFRFFGLRSQLTDTFIRYRFSFRGLPTERKLNGCCIFENIASLTNPGIGISVPVSSYTVYTLEGFEGISYPPQSVTVNGTDTFPKNFPISPNGLFSGQITSLTPNPYFNGDAEFNFVYLQGYQSLVNSGAQRISFKMKVERYDCGELTTYNLYIVLFNAPNAGAPPFTPGIIP